MAESWNHKIRSDPYSWEVKPPEQPVSGREWEMDSPAPVERMNGTILKIRTMRNAN